MRDNTRYIIFGILATAVIGALLFFFSNHETPDTDRPEENGTAMTEAPTGWKTFQSDAIGFRVFLPNETIIDDTVAISPGIQFRIEGPTQEKNTELFDGFSITVTNQMRDTSLRDVVEEEVANTKRIGTIIRGVHRTEFGDRDAFAYTAETLGRITHTFVPLSETEFIQVSYQFADPTGQGYQETLEEILDSFTLLR